MYEQLGPNQEMATYGARIVETLLRNMAFGAKKALDKPDEENIHDLRVTCLRLRHAVRLFDRLFGDRRARKVRRRLRDVQDLLAAVRSCDVAGQVLALEPVAASMSPRERKRILAVLTQERRRSLRPLRARLRKMQRSNVTQRWRTRLLGAA